MSYHFASDVHLRDDHPERDDRFRTWVAGLSPDDRLVIVGDLCDFWMASRRSSRWLARYPSLQALAEFRRAGGSLAIMAGNHDAWLCPFYASALGATVLDEPADLVAYGLRVHLVHGHRLGARRPWKAGLEGSAFFTAFGLLPGPIAGPLDRILTWRNERKLLDDEERHLLVYRTYAASCRDRADIVVIGHVHRPVDERAGGPRLVVLGGWQARSSYLTIDEHGATFHVVPDSQPADASPRAQQQPLAGHLPPAIPT